MQSGLVFDIQRFCTHDGYGIRTVVFLKGCPLDCWWCHNPESKKPRRELFHNPSVCINCGNCITACPQKAHVIVDGAHEFVRAECELCMQCVDRCFSGSMEAVGQIMSVEDVIREVEKDRAFYDESGGGITLSGGEPIAQFDFTLGLLEAARESGIGTCIETSGFGPAERFLKVVPYTDLFLWDIKDTDSDRHRLNTGVSIGSIISNLKAVDLQGGNTILRCILISGVNLNDEHLDKVGALLGTLRNCRGVELMPYHPYGGSKFAKLGMKISGDKEHIPTPEQMLQAKDYLIEKWGVTPLEW